MMRRRPAPTAVVVSTCVLLGKRYRAVPRITKKGGPYLRPGAAGTGPSAPGSGPGSEALRERVLPCEQAVSDRNVTPSRHAQLLPQHVAVRLGGPRRDAETLADFFVGEARRDELNHFLLPRRECGNRLGQDLVHAVDATNVTAA
jgi:hypothetical protein